MYFFIILIFVLQIWDCSCGDGITLPTEIVYLTGITIFAMFCAIVALTVIICKHKKKEKGSDSFIFKIRDKQVSISKYERQLSGNSERTSMRLSYNEDTVQLTPNDNCAIVHNKTVQEEKSVKDSANVVSIENETKPKVNIKPLKFPDSGLDKEQMKRICQGVIEKARIKESTSMSDLDKILADTGEQPTQTSDISASTPELDTYDVLPSPLPVKKSIFGDNHFKAQEEIMAKFNRSQLKSTASISEFIPQVIEEVEPDENNSEITSTNDKLNICQDDINPEIAQKLITENMQESSNGDDNTKVELKDILKKITESDELDSVATETTGVGKDSIYDCPPPPRCRNIIVSDDDDAHGYLYPISNSMELINEPYYSNAKSVTNLDIPQ